MGEIIVSLVLLAAALYGMYRLYMHNRKKSGKTSGTSSGRSGSGTRLK